MHRLLGRSLYRNVRRIQKSHASAPHSSSDNQWMLLSSSKNKSMMISRCLNLRMEILILANQAIKTLMWGIDVSQRPNEMRSGNEDNRPQMVKSKTMRLKRCLRQALPPREIRPTIVIAHLWQNIVLPLQLLIISARNSLTKVTIALERTLWLVARSKSMNLVVNVCNSKSLKVRKSNLNKHLILNLIFRIAMTTMMMKKF